jgi:hypothetical protein
MILTEFLRECVAWLRSWPTAAAAAMTRWTRDFHDPVEGPPDGRAWCLRCEVEYPCDEFVRLTDLLTALERKS